MWALPDLKRLNDQAARNANKFHQAIRTGELDGEPIKCEHCDAQADVRYAWYDIFGDDAKGVLGLCERHDGFYGSPPEGYFTCAACEKVFAENYTWERYAISTEEGDLCLNCARDRALADDTNWIDLTEKAIEAVDSVRIRSCQHLIAVGQACPAELQFIGNVEVDGSTGGRLTSCSTCEDSPEGAVEEIKALLRKAREDGHGRAILILDGAFQFSLSIGVFVHQGGAKADPAEKAFAT